VGVGVRAERCSVVGLSCFDCCVLYVQWEVFACVFGWCYVLVVVFEWMHRECTLMIRDFLTICIGIGDSSFAAKNTRVFA